MIDNSRDDIASLIITCSIGISVCDIREDAIMKKNVPINNVTYMAMDNRASSRNDKSLIINKYYFNKDYTSSIYFSKKYYE